MELAKIIEWEEKTELTIFPIFYRVDPSDVRNQTGSFAEALAAHEEDLEIDVEKIRMWKDAFKKVGSIVGWHIHDMYESTIIQEISGSISRELNSRFSRHDYNKLVAIDSHVEEMMKLLDMESNDVRFVGIHGMGGIGKTTLAEIIYDRVSNCRFEGSSFISCIREKSTTARDLASLQKQLLSTIMQEEIHVWDHHQGIRMIMKMLQNKRVFIVLDDVDSEKQLTALAGNQKWFGPGSRVIITCRDSHLLRTHGVYDIYKVKQLRAAKALQLFSLSAFKKTHPTENYMDLSKHFVKYAQGLPLALKVLGSFLFGRTMDAWESARDQLEAVPNKDIINILQLSFEGLEDSQKKLFLDMACFFQEEWLNNNFKEILKSFGYYPDIDIDILVDKSLISKSKYERLFMHDLLKKMGQEIVRRECPEEPGRRSRLFRHEDVFHVLKNDTGTDAIEGVVLDFCPKTKERLNAKALSRMRKLRYFEIHHSRTIKWHGDPLKYMPTNEL
ncbi:disease resistance protein RUN1-like [Juglans microcarpa x Juglans regia]|uniref:disease resistance protein RUN1-like n=1 Tax=Juglans microcarpa x Juglans regia TaxID=2249226 RepID=UPI001B7DC2D1|nr:disease resistance protein RUN1-like [Juglans microcarpa x Juglans regia]XP_041002019.1 disease resistance protein RUN1-like [Juglans microcarpa x Juglans regia]